MLLYSFLGSRCRLADRSAKCQHALITFSVMGSRHHVSIMLYDDLPLVDVSAGTHSDLSNEGNATISSNETSRLDYNHTITNATEPLRNMLDLALRSWYTAEDNT